MTRQTNILLAADTFMPGQGGISRVARLMAKVLLEHYTEKVKTTALIYSDQPNDTGFFTNQQSARNSKLKFFILNHINAFKCDLFIYDFSGIARAHCTIPGLRKPCMTWIHGIEVWENARPVYAKIAKRATILLSNSEYTLKKAESIHGPFPNARVCWLGTETDEQSTLGPPKLTCKTISIIGRIDKQSYKGHFPLIQCWPDVVAKVPDARLQIVGDGPGKHLVKSAAEKSPVASHIDVKGFVPEDKMDNVWKHTRALAMPSRGEGFGIVYIEAMRHGRPIIASIHDAAKEINIDGETGFNIDLKVPGQLSDRIVLLLTNYNKTVEMGKNGNRRWTKYFSYTQFSNRFQHILNEILDR